MGGIKRHADHTSIGSVASPVRANNDFSGTHEISINFREHARDGHVMARNFYHGVQVVYMGIQDLTTTDDIQPGKVVKPLPLSNSRFVVSWNSVL